MHACLCARPCLALQGSNGLRSVARVEYPWAVNYATVCPTDTRLAAVVGDDPTTHLTDIASGACRGPGGVQVAAVALWGSFLKPTQQLPAVEASAILSVCFA